MIVIKMESSKNSISSSMPLKVTPTFKEGINANTKTKQPQNQANQINKIPSGDD